jgi:hypothetical protein
MATNLDRLRNVQFSTNSAESAYDTADAVDSKIRMNIGVVPNDQIQTINDQDLIGATEEPSDAELLSQGLAFPFAQNRVKPHTLAFIAAFAMGSVATTTPPSGTTARKHTITPASAAAQNSFTMEALMKTGVQNKWSGLFVDSFGLAFERGTNRFVDLTGQAFGSGTQAAGTATESEISEGGINAATCGIFLDVTTYDGSMTEDLDTTANDLTSNPSSDKANAVSWEWGYNNNMDIDFLYEVGSGNQIGGADRLARSQTLRYTRLYQDDAYRTNIINQSEFAMQVKVRNAQIAAEGLYYGFQVMFPLLQLANREVAEQGGRMVEILDFHVLQHATHGSVILDVFNVQTAYMA